MKPKIFSISIFFIVTTLLVSACSDVAAIFPRQSISSTPILSDGDEQPANQTTLESSDHTASVSSQPPSNAPLPESAVISAYEGILENIYSQVNPSVVNIRVVDKIENTQNYSQIPENPFSNIPGFPEIPNFPSIPDNTEPNTPQYSQSLGSGFVWDKEGHIVTNYHVLKGADKIEVTFYDDTIVSAELVGGDENSDLAVLKVELPAEQLYPVSLADSEAIKVGQLAIAIGNPYGLEGTMTAGIISGLDRSLSVESATVNGANYSIPDIIQTDAPINPGNSGGVLVDDRGMVIGVTSAIESTDGSNSGIGFVIPSSLVQKVVPSLIETGAYEHPYLGISGTSLTSDLATAMNLDDNQRGALVIEVVADGPADEAGLIGSDRKVTIDGRDYLVGGDVIIAVDSQTIKEMDDIIAYLANNTEVGQKVTITILRDGKEKQLNVKLDARPSQQIMTAEKTNSQGVWLGISTVAVNEEIARALNLSDEQTGLLIQEVEATSPADKAGLKGGYRSIKIDGVRILLGGDVVFALDGKKVSNRDEMVELLRNYQAGNHVNLSILRDGIEMEVSVKLEEKP